MGSRSWLSRVATAIAAAALGVAAMGGRVAHAASPAEKAMAESLFREAKKLLAKKSVAEACRKLEESQKLDPALGTLLNLAQCHEQEGKLAAAWSEYQLAAEQARTSHRPDRVAIATRKYRELDKKVPRLTIDLKWPAPNGLEVKVDGTAIGLAAVGTPLAVDPGEHELEIVAPYYKPYTEQLSLQVGDARSVTPPPLVALPKPPPAPKPGDAGGDAAGPWRTLGYVGIGLSAAALGIGTGLGLRAMSLGDTVALECPGGRCSVEGYDAYETGRDFATGADIAFVAGGLLTGATVAMFVLTSGGARSEESTLELSTSARVEVVPIVGPGDVGARVGVRF